MGRSSVNVNRACDDSCREPGMTILHAPEEEGIMLREGKGLPLIRASGDGKHDGHTFVLRMSGKTVNLRGTHAKITRSIPVSTNAQTQ